MSRIMKFMLSLLLGVYALTAAAQDDGLATGLAAIQHEWARIHYQLPKDQQDAIKQKLEKTVTEHFEARQQRRLLELKRLEEELKRLRDSIDKRQEAQPKIVNRRVSELLGLKDEPQF